MVREAQGAGPRTYRIGVKDVVTVRGSLPAGRNTASGNPAVPALAAMMLEQGTTRQNKFQINERLDAVGASISFRSGNDTLDISAKALKKDLPLVLELMSEQLRLPAFSAEEFAKAKQQMAGGLKRSLESTYLRAADAFRLAIYPVGHSNFAPSAEEIQDPDPQSVMAYYFAPEMTSGQSIFSTNLGLSAGDKEFISRLYPYAARS